MFYNPVLFMIISVYSCQYYSKPEQTTYNDTNALVNTDQSLSEILSVVTPSLLEQLPRLLIKRDPERPYPPRIFQHGTVQQVKDYLINSLISNCVRKTYETKTCMCNTTYTDISIIQNTAVNSLVVVAANNKYKQIVVSFRSTLSLRNALYDFDIRKISIPGAPPHVKIHRGFYSYLASVYKPTMKATAGLLINPKYKHYTLHITGYSLGGGVSTLSLPYFYYLLKRLKQRRRTEVYSYSGPRVGDSGFANYITSFRIPLTRSTTQNDIVPLVPPRSMGFTHVGAEVFFTFPSITETSKFVVCSQLYDEDPNCSHNYLGLSNFFFHFTPLGKPLPLQVYC